MDRLARWWGRWRERRGDEWELYMLRVTAAALQVAVGAAQLGSVLLHH